MKASPLEYQKQSIRRMEKFFLDGKGCLLADEMGLGKTLTCLWWWERHPEARPGLVVCPASAKYVWEHEALNNLGIRPYVVEGTLPRPSVLRKLRPELVIVNYDVLSCWLPFLKQCRFRTLFIDEAHYCKSSTTKRTKAVRAIAKEIKHVIAISGTPLMNRPIELFSSLQMVRPDVFRSRIAFAHEYCKPRWTPWGWNYNGACRIPELHDLLEHVCMIRHLKRDVLKELPEKTRRVLPLAMSDETEYREATDSFLSWIGKTNPARLLTAKRAETLVKLGELRRLAARLKLRAAVNWTNEWLESYLDEKIILFAIHRKMIEALARRVRAKSIVIDGSVAGRRRKAVVEQFQRDRSTRVCIGNIKAMGVAVTLTASSTAAFCELDWVPGNMMQAEDRIHRIGQTKPSWIWWLVAAGTIEEDLCEILERKQRVVSGVLDGDASTDDLDVYRQLIERISLREEER